MKTHLCISCFFLALHIVMSTLVYCQVPSAQEVHQKAAEFCDLLNQKAARKSEGIKKFDVSIIKQVSLDEKVVFNVAELINKGFIILPENKNIEPVIAYSLKSDFNYKMDSANLFMQLLLYDIGIRDSIANLKPENKWDKKVSPPVSQLFLQWPPPLASFNEGWIETSWTQSECYNALCPLSNPGSKTNRCVLSCIGTAWAQLLNFHKPPTLFTLDNEDKYVSSTLEIKLDEDSSRYDFPSFSLLNKYLKVVNRKYTIDKNLNDFDMAALNFYVAIKNKTDFTGSLSSASMITYPQTENSGFTHFKYFIVCGQSDWNDFYPTLKTNMMNGMPAILRLTWTSVFNPAHVVICDGYNTNEFFHINVGWGAEYPDNITEAWYNLKTSFPDRFDIVTTAITEISSIKIPQPPISISKSKHKLGKIYINTVSNSVSFELENQSGEKIFIDPFDLGQPFEFSLDDINYQNSCETIEVASNSKQIFYLRAKPCDAQFYSTTWILKVRSDKDYYFALDIEAEGINKQPAIINPVQNLHNSNKAISIYPNPFNDILFIEGLENEEAKAYLFSANGRLVRTIEKSDFNSINLKDLSKGLYILKITLPNSQYVFRVVKI